MATTPNLNLPIASPEETEKYFSEFRSDVYDSIMKLDSVVHQIKNAQEASAESPQVVQADYNQNDPLMADYIQNRPCYEVPYEITWDGNSDGLISLGLDQMRAYGIILARDCSELLGQYPYVTMTLGDPEQASEGSPYAGAVCSDSPFTYNKFIDDAGTESYSLCASVPTVYLYQFVDAAATEWTFVGETTIPESTDSAGATVYQLGTKDMAWTNVDIINASTNEIFLSSSDPKKIVPDNFDIYCVQKEYIPSENTAGNTFFTSMTYGGETSLYAENPIVNVVYFDDELSVYLIEESILNVPEAGMYKIGSKFFGTDVNACLYIPQPGVYFAKHDSGDGGSLFVSKFLHSYIKKLSYSYLPFHFVGAGDTNSLSSLDFSQYKEGDILLLIGGEALASIS